MPSAPYSMIEVLALNAAVRLQDASCGIGESAASRDLNFRPIIYSSRNRVREFATASRSFPGTSIAGDDFRLGSGTQ